MPYPLPFVIRAGNDEYIRVIAATQRSAFSSNILRRALQHFVRQLDERRTHVNSTRAGTASTGARKPRR